MRRVALLLIPVLAILVLAVWRFRLTPATPPPGQTPLMLAAAQGDTARIKALLAQGADARALTPDGRNAMDFAAMGGVCQLPALLTLKNRVPDLQLHEPSQFWRTVEVVKIKGCAALDRVTRFR